MNTQNVRTVSDWNNFEVSKQKVLKDLTAKMETLKARRADLLLKFADGGDKDVKKDIETIEKEQKSLATEIEAVEGLLLAIPKRRDFARADEIESTIGEIVDLENKLAKSEEKIDTLIDTLAIGLRDYSNLLKQLYRLNTQKLDARSISTLVKDAISFYLHKYNIYEMIGIGSLRGYESFVDSSKKRVHKPIAGLLNNLRDQVNYLRGLSVLNSDMCPKCFGRLQYSDFRDGARRCSKCGANEAEWQGPKNHKTNI